MRRRNKLRGKKLSDRIFMLLAVCLGAYAFMSNQNVVPTSGDDNLPKEKSIKIPEDENKSGALIDHIAGSLDLKDYPHGTVLDFRQGEGAPVQCGQEVQVRYSTVLLDGTPLEDFLDNGAPVQLTIGKESSVIPGVVRYTMGMHLGGERQVTLPAELAYDAEGFRRKDVPLGSPVMLRLKLMGVKEDKILEENKGYNLFNIVQASSRRQAWCGQEVTVMVHNLTGRDVKELLPSAEGYTAQFTVGARGVPLWLEQAVAGDGSFKPLGLGGYRGLRLSDDLTATKKFHEWEGASQLKLPSGKEAVLRVQLIAIGNEKIEVEEPAADKAEEGWKHDTSETDAKDEAGEKPAAEAKPDAENKEESEEE